MTSKVNTSMKSRLPRKQFPSKIASTARTAKSGERCPVMGLWVTAGRKRDGHFLLEGSIMRADGGQSVTWTLVSSEAGLTDSRRPLSFKEPSSKVVNLPGSQGSSPDTRHADGADAYEPKLSPDRSSGLRVRGLLVTPVGCEEGCFYCEGPETD